MPITESSHRVICKHLVNLFKAMEQLPTDVEPERIRIVLHDIDTAVSDIQFIIREVNPS